MNDRPHEILECHHRRKHDMRSTIISALGILFILLAGVWINRNIDEITDAFEDLKEVTFLARHMHTVIGSHYCHHALWQLLVQSRRY